MGYTHNWTQKKTFTEQEWRLICNEARQIIKASNVPVSYEYDVTQAPCIDDDCIRLNGTGDDGHETFYIARKRTQEPWHYCKTAFCKTACKPYDKIVVMILNHIHQQHGDMFTISTDGDMFELDGKHYIETLD
jgi:hypothetical protein